MNKITLVLALFALTFTSVLGTCTNNYLAQHYNIELEENEVDSTSFTKCSSLADFQTSCCSSTTIDTFQAKATALVEELKAAVIERDNFFVTARRSAAMSRVSIEKLRNSTAEAMASIEELTNGNGNELGEEGLVYLMILGMGQVFTEIGGSMIGNLTNFQANFTDYQTKRSECISTVVDVTSASWCLACHPDAATLGLNNDGTTIALDSSLQDRLNDNCAPFIEYSVQQNAVIAVHFMSSILHALANAIEAIASGDANGGLETFVGAIASSAAAPTPKGSSQIPTHFPDGCDGESCPWIYSDKDGFWSNGILNKTALAAGGIVEMRDTDGFKIEVSARRLLEEDMNRVLSGTPRLLSWSPEENEAGVTVDFPENPADVDNDEDLESLPQLSGFRVGLAGLALAALSFLFF